jgi:hypothetical protein
MSCWRAAAGGHPHRSTRSAPRCCVLGACRVAGQEPWERRPNESRDLGLPSVNLCEVDYEPCETRAV